MDFINYLHQVSNCKFRTLRAGQQFVMELFPIRPDLYHKVTGSPLDPFYDDNRLAECLLFLIDNWELIDYSYFKKIETPIDY